MQEIASGVFLETSYDGVNVAAMITDEGVICIDVPSYPRDARDWAGRVGRLHGRGVRYLILTDYNADRIVNTRWFSVPIIASQPTAERLGAYDRRYPQQLLDSLAHRNPLLGRELVSGPVDQAAVSFAGAMSIHSGQHHIKLLHRPGPGAGNIWVSWPEAGILFAGDSIVVGVHPPLAEVLLAEWIESLESLEPDDPHITLLVPGRGRPGGPELVSNMITYLRGLESVVDQHIADGGSRQELARLVPAIADRLPSHDLAPDWTMRDIGLGLQRAYDQKMAPTEVPLAE